MPYPPPENTRQVPLSATEKPPLSYVKSLINTFSLVHPPPPSSPHAARLVSVGISHYVEKVRWGFDIKSTTQSSPSSSSASAFSYCEDAHPPGLAALFTTALDPSTSATPIIQYVDRRSSSSPSAPPLVLKDSTAILTSLCPFLYGPDKAKAAEVLEWEERFDRELGPAARVFAYQYLLDKKFQPLLIDIGGRETSWIERKVFKLAIERNVLQRNMSKFMSIDRANAERSEQDITKLFAAVGSRLEKSKFIVGDTFTAADLTFAALSSPVLGAIPELSRLSPPLETFPPEIKSLAARLRETPAGQHALRCYGEYRFATLVPAAETTGGGTVVVRPSKSLGRTVEFRSGGPRNNKVAIAAAAALIGGCILGLPILGAYSYFSRDRDNNNKKKK